MARRVYGEGKTCAARAVRGLAVCILSAKRVQCEQPCAIGVQIGGVSAYAFGMNEPNHLKMSATEYSRRKIPV